MAHHLLLLHGALGSAGQFRPLLDQMPPHLDALAFSFPGHGGSITNEKFSIDLFVRDTLAHMDARQIAEADLLGYSMGGYVALQFARTHPHRVRRIITLGTKFEWNPEQAEKEVRMMNPDVIEQKVPAFAEALATRHAPADWKAIMRNTADMMTRLGAGEAMSAADFALIPHPVLVCRGASDHMVTEAESRQTAEALPNGTFRSLEGIKHPMESIPAEVLAEFCQDWFR